LFSFFPAVSLISFIKIFEYFVFVIALTQNVGLVKKFAGKALSISLVWTLMLSLLQIKLGHTLGGVFYYLGERSFSINSPGISLFSANNSLYLRPYASFPHPNALAGFALIGIFLLVYLKPKSILEKLGIISGVILVMLSHSQAAWIALAVGMLLLFFRQVAIRLLRPVLFISLIISVLFLFIAPIASQANFTQQSILIRLQLNQSAWLLLKNHPLFGVGLGVFIPALQTLSLPGNFFTLPYFIYQPVHNIFLLMLVQLGGLLFIFLSTVLSKLLKSINNNHLAIAWISVIITGLVDHYWATSQQNILLLCLLVGVSLSDTMKRI
jgi:O-antigen ligase